MKKKFLVATHGKLASGFQNSLTILAGRGADLVVVDAYLTNEDYTPIISDFINSVNADEQGIIFTDLYGGSVNQTAVTELMRNKKEQIFVISNSNLAIILSLVLTSESEIFTQKSINEAINDCQVRLVSTQLPEEEALF